MNPLRHVLITGRYYPTAPRGLTLREGLKSQGIRISEVHIDHHTPRPWTWRLDRKLNGFNEKVDAVILADLGQEVVWAARRTANRLRVPLITDFFFSFHEALVHDRSVVGEGSLKARRLHRADLDTLLLSDACYFDTREHQRYVMKAFPGAIQRSFVIPIGCPTDFFMEQVPQILDGWGRFNILFWGSYIPLQGIEHIIHAAHQLKDDTDIVFHLIGKQGLTYPQIRELENSLHPGNVRFVDRIDPKILRSHIKAADVALGIFGNTPKAFRVVPHKVYEAMAMGVPCISISSPAMDELIPRSACLQVNPGDISNAIRTLKSDSGFRQTLGKAGAVFMRQTMHPDILGQKLVEGIESVRRMPHSR